jgi:hypothetical protein
MQIQSFNCASVRKEILGGEFSISLAVSVPARKKGLRMSRDALSFPVASLAHRAGDGGT